MKVHMHECGGVECAHMLRGVYYGATHIKEALAIEWRDVELRTTLVAIPVEENLPILRQVLVLLVQSLASPF
jgi:hypothetical protein